MREVFERTNICNSSLNRTLQGLARLELLSTRAWRVHYRQQSSTIRGLQTRLRPSLSNTRRRASRAAVAALNQAIRLGGVKTGSRSNMGSGLRPAFAWIAVVVLALPAAIHAQTDIRSSFQ